jgi:nicotinamide-nucleotide amidase
MPTCELVTIGSELLNGSVLNTNAQFLARELTRLDFSVTYQISCRDEEPEILNVLSAAFKRSDLIIVTGGLGPTPDDITREAIAKFFRCGLKFNQAQYRRITHYFRTLNRTAPFLTKREAFFPETAKPILNKFGIALGFYVAQNGKLLIALPGVPMELVRMFETGVKKLILRHFKNRPKAYQLEARIAGFYETQIMRKLSPRFFQNRDFDFGIYPEVGEVVIRLKSRSKSLIRILKRELRKRMGSALYSFKDQSMAELIALSLIRKRRTLAVAESCTGGMLAQKLTAFSGASTFFKGGTVAYSNEAKQNQLGVSKELIRKYGAVSSETAKAMARAARERYQASIGVSVTGIAGPTGGSAQKPVGLIYFGISDKNGTSSFKSRFLGERGKVRSQAAQKALLLLFRHIEGGSVFRRRKWIA